MFDEPSIGLHPLDVRTLIDIFQKLIDQGATVIVIEHDLDGDGHILGGFGQPGGGQQGGRIIASGTPSRIAENPDSVTGRYLR